MSQNQEFENLYEVVKTVRFALSPNFSKNEDGNYSKFRTHQEFKELVEYSFKKLEEEIDKNAENQITEKESVEIIYIYLPILFGIAQDYKKFITRFDTLILSEDYYRLLARKAKFNSFDSKEKYDKREGKNVIVTTPKVSSGYVLLTGTNKYQGKERSDLISDYLLDLINRIFTLYSQIETQLEKYFNAFNHENLAHTKPNIVHFRKLFLSLSNLISELLEPICNGSIIINKPDKLPESDENHQLKKFFNSDNFELIRNAILNKNQVVDYYKLNGSQIPFGKVSLNYYTAVQKPNIVEKEIEEIIQRLELETFVKKYVNLEPDQIIDALKFNIPDKTSQFLKNTLKLTKIELAQLFKPKPIPFNLIHFLAERFSNKLDAEYSKVEFILSRIGRTVSISDDFDKIGNKEELNLQSYPIKLAFDYAWESLARNKNELIPDLKFAKEKSINFFNEFEVDSNNSNFILYSDLLFIADQLAVLEYQEIKDKQTIDEIVYKIDKKLEVIVNPFSQRETKCKIFDSDLEKVYQSLSNISNLKNNIAFQKAKQALGLIRGGLKNKITKYNQLTERFKVISPDLGRNFADLREKTREQDENNKISHYGVIVSDRDGYDYILTKPLTLVDSRDVIENKLSNTEGENTIKIKKVFSLTSKSLKKIYSNKGSFPDFRLPKNTNELSQPEETKVIKDHKKFLYIQRCLTDSEMAKAQKWNDKFSIKDFNWDNAIKDCKNYEQIEKVIDLNGYKLEEKWLEYDDITNLIKKDGCLLLPILNQDVQNRANKTNSRFVSNQNQFTSDLNKAIKNEDAYRIHPEFSLYYKLPSIKPDLSLGETLASLQNAHHNKILNRNSRLQILGNFQIEIKNIANTLNKKDQLELWKSQDKLASHIDSFNKDVIGPEQDYIFGIDRGIKQLATLSVTNKKGDIQSFDIYIREFDHTHKNWVHNFFEKRYCLDLTNLRVETAISGEKLLVDLSKIPVKQNNGENLQNIKLKQAAYIRKVQYKMSSEENSVINFIASDTDFSELNSRIGDLITPFKEGKHFTDLPTEQLKNLLSAFYKLKTDKSLSETDKKILEKQTIELDPVDDLKRGVVANMIGVICHLLNKFDYKAIIAIENLNRSFYDSIDGLSSQNLSRDLDFKEQENLVLAGLGTYHFFEVQLLKKLSKLQLDDKILNFVPSFRSQENYEAITKYRSPLTYKQFGHVFFVDPRNTSKKCPVCEEAHKVRRANNIFTCNNCHFITGQNNLEILNQFKKSETINHLTNGDENGAYNIAMKLLRIDGGR